jgi:hypothetical protein
MRMVDKNKDPDIYLSMSRFYTDLVLEEKKKEDGDVSKVLRDVPDDILEEILDTTDTWDYLSVEQSRELGMPTDDKSSAISPSHYKEILPGYEYMDMMVHMLDRMGGIEAHLMGQIYKYLMRYGNKDDKLQELGKVHWYLTYLMIIQDADEEDLIRITQDIASRYP